MPPGSFRKESKMPVKASRKAHRIPPRRPRSGPGGLGSLQEAPRAPKEAPETDENLPSALHGRLWSLPGSILDPPKLNFEAARIYFGALKSDFGAFQ